MKKLFTVLAAVILTASVFAQSPDKMSYQAVIRNLSNNLVTSTAVGMQISILQGSTSGTAVYVETQTPTTNANGLISIEIGAGTVQSGDFTTIDWANGPYFIKTETDIAGGTNYTITGTSQLLSVPYALHAKTAETVTGGGGFTHYVGELYGGGIIVSVWKESSVEHGLIASLTDVSSGAQWSSITETLIGATAQSPFDGQANTIAIVAQGDVSGAAYLCDNYSSGGFNDWYLPAAWELNQCYNASLVVNTILGATDGFQFAYYWSSTESSNNYAWIQNFYYGTSNYGTKGITYRVHAVRRF
ncbi:MAG: hypothetical protein A2046_05535 [Bacteroidetes bacterium GWA2_30_7]|nr:MAG: hypothetical protein A2046_05535 [Bacteroidetes bacterium GWA2_30_7]